MAAESKSEPPAAPEWGRRVSSLESDVTLDADHYGVDLAIIISKHEEFVKLKEVLGKGFDNQQLGIDEYSNQFFQVTVKGKTIDFVTFGAQGIQPFALRIATYLNKFCPQNCLLLGTSATRRSDIELGEAFYIYKSFNYEEGKRNEEGLFLNARPFSCVPMLTWFPDERIKSGCGASGCAVVNDGFPEWDHLVQYERNLLGVDMESSVFFEACALYGVNCLGSIRGVVDNMIRKNDDAHILAWKHIATVLKLFVFPNLHSLGTYTSRRKVDGEKLAEQYYNNCLRHVLNLIDKVYIIKFSVERLESLDHTALSGWKRLKGLVQADLQDDSMRRTWSLQKLRGEYCDVPTNMTSLINDAQREWNYAKYWKMLRQLLVKHSKADQVLILDASEL